MSVTGDVKVQTQSGVFTREVINSKNVDFDKAIELTGFGKFQYMIITLCGLIFCCVGFQNGLNAYVMPSAECDLKMSSNEKGLLNAVFLAGGLASAFFWGILADLMGRKKILVFSLILDGIVTAVSSLSQNFLLFAAFRFMNGFLIGAPGSIVVAYLGEFLTNKHRAPSLCAVGFFWTISWMILPAAALGIMPLTWAYRVDGFVYNSWRIYVAIFSVPTLICGLILGIFFPESPKFLYSQGRNEETVNVFRHMFHVTYGNKCGDYPVVTLAAEEKDRSSKLENSNNVRPTKNSGALICGILRQVWSQISYLFSYPVIFSTVLASSLMFSNMFGYYGLGLWLPELFNRFHDHYKVSNVSATVCEITRQKFESTQQPLDILEFNNSSLNHTLSLGEECLINEISPTVFVNTFIIGASCLIGNVLSALLAKRLGLKSLTIITALISGICAIAIYFLRTPGQNLLISCLFLTFVGTGNMVLTSVIVDLFATKVRALAVCTAIFAGRLGAVASNLTLGYFLDISCEIPIFLMGFILLCGCFLGFFLPKEQAHDGEEKSTASI
ncbi:hypothetical protein RUM44_005214 [Polyplax serrata]|uniref:Major facilitator superfamily (MFS) profile domain-containing protein n=1 Tax=Polyplax serrata TaxID=468196 RepID=A0ABR1AED9_POLSC